MKNSFPKTVFRTPTPEFEVSELYEISIKPVPGAPNPHECWIVREMHGQRDEATKTFHNEIVTVDPTDKRQFLTCEEAINHANERVLALAKNGFRFLFVMNYAEPTPPWYECVEVTLPDGEYKLLRQIPAPLSVGGWMVDDLGS